MRRFLWSSLAVACALAGAGSLTATAQGGLLSYDDWEGYTLTRASPNLNGWEYVTDVASPPWNTLDNRNSVWIGSAMAGDSTYPLACSGNQFVDMNASYLWQNTGESFVEGVTYTLSLQATAATSNERIYLYIADHDPVEGADLGTSLAMDYFDLPDTDFQWDEYSLSYTATAADAGKEMVFALYGRGASYVDNVSFASAAPEPSSLALGLVGLIGLAFAGRWRRRSRSSSK